MTRRIDQTGYLSCATTIHYLYKHFFPVEEFSKDISPLPKKSFEELVKEYQPSLKSFLYRLTASKEDAACIMKTLPLEHYRAVE